MERSGFQDFDTVTLSAPQASSATISSDPVDVAPFDSLTVLFGIGIDAALDGSNYLTLSLSECATVGGSYTAVGAADIDDGSTSPSASILVNATAEDDTTYKLTYIGNLQFVKGVITETGTLDGPISMTAILGRHRMGPAQQASLAIAS